MAFIEKYEERPLEPTRRHSGVTCGYKAVTIDSQLFLQLETYGSKDRKMPDKVSQVLQLDEAAARELRRIIDLTFPAR